MALHYPHARSKENKQGLHYSGFSGLIHRPTTDSQGNYFSTRSISRPNPLSWAREDAIMIISYMNEYDGYPAPELVARAQRAAFERVRREREEKAKRQKLELEEILRHQPNDFAD
jgi:hypothetical protein